MSQALGGGCRRLYVSLTVQTQSALPPSPLSSPPTPPPALWCVFEELRNEPPPAADLDDDTSLTLSSQPPPGLQPQSASWDPNDQRWVVKLHRSHGDMRKRSGNSQQDGDGLIFYNLCYYRDRNDKERTKRWLAKWSANPSKIRDFRQLQNSDAAHDLKYWLNETRRYPGLWKAKGFKMGPFHRILTMRCPEVGHTIY